MNDFKVVGALLGTAILGGMSAGVFNAFTAPKGGGFALAFAWALAGLLILAYMTIMGRMLMKSRWDHQKRMEAILGRNAKYWDEYHRANSQG